MGNEGGWSLSTPENMKDVKPWLLVLVAAALALALGVGGIWDPLERRVYDKSIGLLSAGNSIMDGYVEVIGIDEASLQSVGPWPWSRAVLADLLERTAKTGAQVIVLDVLLAEAKEDDVGLQSTMAGPASIILPYQGIATSVVYPHPSFLSHATLAHGDVLVDPDGRVRRIPALTAGKTEDDTPMLVPPPPGVISPLAVSIEAVRQFVGINRDRGTAPLVLPVRVQSNTLSIGVAEYPLDRRGNLLFTFPPVGGSTSVWPPGKMHSAVDVLNGKIEPGQLENKLVFIGTTAVGLPDRHMSSKIHHGPIPGVFVHAATAWALLSGNVVGLMSPVMLGLLTLALIVFEVGYVYRQEVMPSLLVTLLGLLITGLLYIVLIFYYHIWFPIVHLVGTTVVFYVYGLAYRYTKAKAARERLANSLCRYFSPSVLEEILASEAGLVTREVEGTVLFADLSGFTSLAEKLPPLTTVSVLNQHLTGLVEIVFEYGGTLDKFTGDGVMAFFGAPLPNSAHRELAVAAAWDMQEFCEGLSKRGKTGLELFQLKLAVGIASGRFVVGNIGAGDRYDYTAIGDVVNTAARLEQLAGPGEILLDEHVAGNLSCQWEIQDVGKQLLRGKQSLQQVYRLVGRRGRDHDQANGGKENLNN